MYIVMEVENHPDRCIGDIFGPFDTRPEAEAFAEDKYNCSFNFNAPYNHRMNTYTVHLLDSPKGA